VEPDPGISVTTDAPAPAQTFASLRQRILRGSAWVMGGKVATIFLSIAINGLIARLLPKPQVAAYFQTITLVVIGSTIAQMGLDRAAVRFVASSLAARQPGRARAAIRTVFAYGVAASVVLALALILGLGDWLFRIIAPQDTAILAGIIPIAAGWLIVTALQSLLVETFRGLQRFDLSTVLDALLVDVLTAAIFGALYLAHRHPSLEDLVLLSAAATMVAVLIAAGLMLGRVRTLSGPGEIPPRDIFSFAWPLLITNVAILLLGNGVDLWVMGPYVAPAVIASYGAATRLLVFVATPFLIVQGVTPPIVAELHAQGRKADMERALRAVATLAGIPSFLVLLVFVFFGRTVMGVVFTAQYRDGATILVILSVARLIGIWTGSCSVALMMTGHQRVTMYVALTGGTVSVVGGILVAPHLGAVGVAAVTGAAQVLQNLVQLLLAKRLVGVWTHIQFAPRPVLEFLSGKESLRSRRPNR
jgi:O-antigen/teichoic acid export membrane protein